jgi:SAM-dependent methyltransferase
MELNFPAQSPAAFDRFAAVYDQHWGRVSLKWLAWLSLLLGPRLPDGARLLDVCCGTGQIAGEMSRRGYWVVGLDGASSMLRHAHVNAPDASLLQADVRRFGLRAQFDAAYCVFDSLNHLLSTRDLTSAFDSVYSCLRPGGWFLFDINTELGYLVNWKGTRHLSIEGARVRTRSDYDAAKRLAVFRAVIRGVSPGSRPSEEVVLLQRCHSADDIRAALSRAGLRFVESFGIEGGALMSGDHPQAQRVFYLCRRPTKSTGRTPGEGHVETRQPHARQ